MTLNADGLLSVRGSAGYRCFYKTIDSQIVPLDMRCLLESLEKIVHGILFKVMACILHSGPLHVRTSTLHAKISAYAKVNGELGKLEYVKYRYSEL
jgi:hypothetical protein